jgi:MFS family permease
MLTHKDALGLTTRQAASAGTFYLVGAIAGAFVFGLTDRFGRMNLFTITLAIYLVFTVASGLAWNYWSFVGSACWPGPASAASTPSTGTPTARPA